MALSLAAWRRRQTHTAQLIVSLEMIYNTFKSNQFTTNTFNNDDNIRYSKLKIIHFYT